jgi:hypothetical protein
VRLVHSIVFLILTAFIGQLVATYYAVKKDAIEWNEVDYDDDAEDQEDIESDWIAHNPFDPNKTLEIRVVPNLYFYYKNHIKHLEFYLTIDNPPEIWS